MNRHSRISRFPLALMALSAMSCFAEAAGTATSDNPEGVSAPRSPVEYICKEKSLIGNEIKEAGEKCLYAGLPAENLIPTCDIGRARFQEYLESNKVRVAKMIEENKGPGALDPQAFMANMLKVQAEMAAEQTEKNTAAIAGAVAHAVTAALGAMFPNGFPTAAPVLTEPAPAASATPPATELSKLEDTGKAQKQSKG